MARLLIDEFEKRLISKGYEGYTLTVHKSNSRANNFYKKIGMEIYDSNNNGYK